MTENTLDTNQYFNSLNLNDKRREKFFVDMMNILYKAPGESILNASGSREKAKKIYRLLNHIEELSDNVLESIATATMAKVKIATEQGERVLFIQDTTSISYGYRKIEGMGYYCDSSRKGMNVHSCIAVTESGIVLGMVHQETQTREKQKSDRKKGYQTKSRAIEDKENFRWIHTAKMVQKQVLAAEADKDCMLVCDREGDFYELFAECCELKLPLLVRLTQNRCLKEKVEKERKLLDALKAMKPVGTMKVKVSRNPAKKEPERIAIMEYQFGEFQLKKPAIRREKELPESVIVNAVFVHEKEEKEEALHWFLLTTEKINGKEEAERLIQDYIARWKIECFHHVLKSGCKIEEKQTRSYSSLSILTLLYSVIALIILNLTYMGRVCPNVPASVVFTMEECHVLYHAANKTREEINHEYTIKEAIHDLAVLGGRKGAPSDGLTGVNSIWKGLFRLGILLEYASFVL